MDESITPLTEVIASHVLPSEVVLACSLTLVLSGEKSQNSKAQSVVKPSVEPLSKEMQVDSMVVSSTMSERLFEGDLPEGKGLESCILVAGDELVAVQSLASLRGDSQPTLLEHESFDVESDKEEEEDVLLKWSKRGVRGTNSSQINVPDLETVLGTPEVDHVVEPTKFVKERQRKGKGKLVVSHPKWEKRKYVTRSETQKVLGSAIGASRVQTKRARKKRWESIEPKKPTSTPLPIKSSDIESEDVAAYVAKKRKESEKARVKTKEVQKATKKSPVKREKVRK
ncbi:hypothetical protein KY284_032842 [Solanum tuberosum]|nr:hypothetical protein KY284_032842 [Solanum tuberosum]